MRVHIISDIHLETNRKYTHVQPDCDIVLVAGDVCPGNVTNGTDWLKQTFSVPVYYIAGNHEYYAFPKTFNTIEDNIRINLQNSNVYFLQNETVVLPGLRILGTTLWTNFQLDGNLNYNLELARRGMNDYYSCAYNTNQIFLQPEDTKLEHDLAVEFLLEELSKPFDGKTVVMTHHCPHPLSIHSKYAGDPLNPAFTSDLSNIIEKMEIDYWIHGHTHSNFDYVVNDTRVICNPLGYGRVSYGNFANRMENPEFIEDLVIDV